MKKSCLILRAVALCIALLATAAAHAQKAPKPAIDPVSPAQLREEYRDLTNKLVAEWLDTGKLSPDSIQAYHLLVAMATRQGLRLEKVPLRTNDERNLGAALAVARLEALGFGYDKIYRLNLRQTN